MAKFGEYLPVALDVDVAEPVVLLQLMLICRVEKVKLCLAQSIGTDGQCQQQVSHVALPQID
jgi:hypothetical protein